VAVGIAKLEFYNNLRKGGNRVAEDPEIVTMRYPTGFVHLPKVDAEYLQQLCAEQLVTRRDRNGFAGARMAEDARAQRSPGLLRVCPRGAAAAGLDRFEERHWRELERADSDSRRPAIPRSANRATH
jgi:phage terminase large subunit GpA-like protein